MALAAGQKARHESVTNKTLTSVVTLSIENTFAECENEEISTKKGEKIIGNQQKGPWEKT